MVVVHSMDRLARNLDDLRTLVKSLTEKGVVIQFKKEGLTFTGEDSPMSTLLLLVMGAFAEFERALIKERQREGIELAKKRGVYKERKLYLKIKLLFCESGLLMEKPKRIWPKNLGLAEKHFINILKLNSQN